MASRSLVARVLPKFPTRVVAGAGMLIEKLNGVWTFAVNGGNLGVQVPPLDTANTYVFVQLPDGSTAKITLAAAIALAIPVEYPGRKNSFLNGGFTVWQRGTNSIQGPAGTRTYTADRWAVTSQGAALSQVSRNNHGISNPPRSGGMLALVGNAGVTTVDIDQRIEAGAGGGTYLLTNPLVAAPQIAFSCYINNVTGSAFTPTLFVETPSAIDNWASSQIVNGGGAGEALQSVPSGGGWTRVTWLGTPGGYPNVGNGIGFRLRIPSGSLDSNAKVLNITDMMVEPRASADGLFSPFEVVDFASELLRCQRYFQKSFPYATKPSQNAGPNASVAISQTVGAAVTMRGWSIRLATVMRNSFTITFFNPSAANAFARNVDAVADCSVTSTVDSGDAGFAILLTTAAGSAAGQRNIIHYTVDAEL
jgi:hypothetical protein